MKHYIVQKTLVEIKYVLNEKNIQTMNNFFLSIKDVIQAPTVLLKAKLLSNINDDFQQNNFEFSCTEEIIIFKYPSYKNICKIVKAHEVPKRQNLNTNEGKIALIHAVAHIEYSAIDLALDACYRFKNMPKQYYSDWIDVALDEQRHFNMLCNLLASYNVQYGDLKVHQGLFDASMRTQDLISRMALIPRYMEANGLDANLMIITKLKNIKDTKEIIKVLQTILDEEVDHVLKGDIWYKYACNQKKDFSCNYFDIVNNVYPNSFKKTKYLNVDARKKAGFSNEEIEVLKNL